MILAARGIAIGSGPIERTAFVLSTLRHLLVSRATRRLSAVVAAAAMMAFGLAVPAASALTPVPPTPPALHTIEPFAAYVPSDSCDPRTKPGTAALAALLTKTYTGTIYYTVRPCEASVSEHYQGRAIDWMVSAKNSAQYADAATFFYWLFLTDKSGNTYSNARRLGVMYLVYNNKIWGSWDRKWEPYNNCANQPGSAYDNACHRTHVHISLSWEGANKRTSFWTGKPVGTDYGPCKSSTLELGRAAPVGPHHTVSDPRHADRSVRRQHAVQAGHPVVRRAGRARQHRAGRGRGPARHRGERRRRFRPGHLRRAEELADRPPHPGERDR